ncbi:cytochrome P450 [Salinispora sp. H7-4]|uniref:cytochrome P450 n=1 Tax=Salinispora sp. H7-4 TaxID=2748321 RepID=UPI0015D3408F|nr:cytochrome P450 [Salinispora sp. H7-4]NYT95616.1 cytochrome P450 [Salinispora sp. H7-4]
MSTEIVSTGNRADIAHPATYAAGVPDAEFARLRREEPVSWVPEAPLWRRSGEGRILSQGPGFWAVTTHEGVVAASRQPEVFSSGRQGAFLADPRTTADLEQARQLLVNMDAPQHARVRKLVTAVFTPRAIRALGESVTAHARNLVERAVRQEECDVVADLAAELPLLVLADLLGLPREDRHLLYQWSNNLVGFDDPEYGGGDVEAYRKTFFEAFQYALSVADERRRTPRGDLMTLLATGEADGRRLTDREFCNFWLLLVVAGNETTRHLITGSVLALVDNPMQRERLVADDTLLPSAVEELLRWVSPIMQFRRTAIVDTELCGTPIAAGDKVVLWYASANRDAAVFEAPDDLRLYRNPNPHLSFGMGPHFCLGAHLARLEARTMLRELAPHLSRFRLTGPVVRLESNFVNGVKSLPGSFTGH